MSDGREWGVGISPSWVSQAVPDGNSSLLSLLPKETDIASKQLKEMKSNSLNSKKALPLISRTKHHHDSRIRRWQCKKPPDADGLFGKLVYFFFSLILYS